MSQLPDETLRKILHQIQQTAHQSSKALSVSRAQISQKEREKRMLHLTVEELTSMPNDENIKMYKGVGKMFMEVPRSTMERDLKNQEKEMADELNTLGKKAKYLEKQFTESQSQLRDIFQSAERQDR
ncbi:hypothetical protein FRC02_005469 [Tulasnella sp. 418]|nr:hypothetical protein FRC02_005469 [Tulasnella sp. 418]